MKGIKQIISILLTLAMMMSMITIPALAEETTEKVVTDNTVLTEPFDVTNEEEVDAGLYPYDKKTVLVKLEKKTKALDVDGVANIEYLFKAKDGYWYTANLSDGTTPKMAIEALRSTSSVLVAEYNYICQTDGPLQDGKGVDEVVHTNPKYDKQWHLDSCGLQDAWKYMKKEGMNPGGSSGIVVAVVDTGVDYDHEDLKNNMWTNPGEIPGDGIDNDGNGYVDDYYGVNIVAKKGNGDDDHGHGTHVAGIIAAANNNVGIVGIAYNTKIMAIKVAQSGELHINDVCKGVNYARENGADVINMSLATNAQSVALEDVLIEAYTQCVLVASAGNDGKPNEERKPDDADAEAWYPAAYSFVLGVMAVNNNGKEASFTNYDVKKFNSPEYELYAPGTDILSTYPNDRYQILQGTSMAAPIVSGMAAVLRSVYNDPDEYPTKFIYGQLTSTSGRTAVCYDNKEHGEHNLPQIVNLYDALTKLPKPDVSVSEYKTFDTPDIDSKNNGDGTIDAGETITLGFELRNRWGMSEDTIVTIDALSPADIPNPYVQFSTDGRNYSNAASINYGSVGTYSTKDCGKIIKNDLVTGWENPFYLKIDKETPNETTLKINVKVTCKNALDEKDSTTYVSSTSIKLNTKYGVVLPQVIDENMTLTKDNYYIIQNATVIEAGATVTVTEGTNIQFWTNDSTNPYADKYMASLVVKGKLNCVGTEEEPIEIFPSNLMSNYRVEIYKSGSGTINYKYTNLTNLNTGEKYTMYTGFSKAENCEFKQNSKGNLNFRYLDGGNVVTNSYKAVIVGGAADNCAFYKLGGENSSYYTQLGVNCNNCIFIDSNINFDNTKTYKDCVFYGNNNYWDGTKGATSTFTVGSNHAYGTSTAQKVVKDDATGKVYLQISPITNVDAIAKFMGGNLAYIETKEELDFIKNSGLTGKLGAELKNGEFHWLNGEKIGDFITISNPSSSYSQLGVSSKNISKGSYSAAIVELPGVVRIEEISLGKENITIDTASIYQLAPAIYPSLASNHELLYFSSNDAILTVDENGLVTPVDVGTATIYVFSEDMQISTSMVIAVKNEVKATEVTAPEELFINIGETKNLNAVVKPTNTTKVATYTCSDENIATVDTSGNITAVSEGVATITAVVSNCDEVLEASTTVHCVIPIESINFEEEYIITKLSDETVLTPTISPKNATSKNCKWESSNEAVCYVNENGELVKNDVGVATLKAISPYSDKIADQITVVVTSDEHINKDVISISSAYDCSYALLEDGTIWEWALCSGDIKKWNPIKTNVQFEGKIEDFWFVPNYYYILSEGSLYEGTYYNGVIGNFRKVDYHNGWNYVDCDNVSRIYGGGDRLYIIFNDGSIVGGKNGTTFFAFEELSDVSDIYIECAGENADATTYILSENYVYVIGYYNGLYYDEPTKIFTGISQLAGKYAVDGYYDPPYQYIIGESSRYNYNRHSDSETMLWMGGSTYITYYIDESGKLYFDEVYVDSDGIFYDMYYYPDNFIENVSKVYETGRNDYYYPTSYYKTKDNQLFAWDWLPETSPHPLVFGLIPKNSELYCDENSFNLTDIVFDDDGNVISSVLSEDRLEIDFNTSLYACTSTSFKDGNDNSVSTSYSTSIEGSKIIKPVKSNPDLTKGAEYQYTVTVKNLLNEEKTISVTFTYLPEEKKIEENIPVEPECPEDDELKHIHSFETETIMPTLEAEGKITNICDCGVTTETVLPKMSKRTDYTAEDYKNAYNEFMKTGYNTSFTGNAILNRLNDTDVNKWLRFIAPSNSNKYGFGGNYWGTTNSELINHQIVDYNDFATLGDIIEGNPLITAPENTFPFVTEAYLTDDSGEVQTIITGGKVKFVVKFNRDMDTEYGLNVYFGSAYPYADYGIDGGFQDARTWVGETELKTVIENGYQFIRVTNGRTAADEKGAHLKLYDDWARFGFEINTASVMAMMMQGYADNEGIHLEWMQDDYETLAGYNVYRATSENGNYVKLNKFVLSPDENTFTDTELVPGQKYYYTFTTVLTDLTESKPAGKISVTAKDTMAPSVYHSPVYTATTGNKVIISATVSDNIGIENAKLYYRVKGTEEWKTAEMSKSNSKYTASIPAAFVTTEGVEYYIAAFDGVNYTYAGSHTSENPYEITVYQAVENNAKGDVDGDGNITVLDALKLLRAIYDESLLTQEEFLRADINGDGSLSAVEALRILQYANKTISSVLW